MLRFILIIVLLGFTGATGPASAAVDGPVAEKLDAVRKINLAGRQRMLSQRMSMATCMVQAGLEPEAFAKLAGESARNFAHVLVALQKGDAQLQLLPTSVPEILAEMAKVERLWDGFEPLVKGTTQVLSVEDFQALHDRNVPLLKQMNRAVGMFEAHLGEGIVHPELKAAINIAGRQRMLSQKVGKELCMIHLGIAPEADATALVATVEQFEGALSDLYNGNAELGLLAAPTEDIGYALLELDDFWRASAAPVLRRGGAGEQLSAEEIIAVIAVLDEVLFRANEIVWMYEGL